MVAVMSFLIVESPLFFFHCLVLLFFLTVRASSWFFVVKLKYMFIEQMTTSIISFTTNTCYHTDTSLYITWVLERYFDIGADELLWPWVLPTIFVSPMATSFFIVYWYLGIDKCCIPQFIQLIVSIIWASFLQKHSITCTV